MVANRVFDEIVDFITSAPMPEQILNFKPSSKVQKRLEELMDKKREEGLNEEEKHELEQFLTIEHIMRLAKARARKRISSNQ
jgi:hypothetical protein